MTTTQEFWGRVAGKYGDENCRSRMADEIDLLEKLGRVRAKALNEQDRLLYKYRVVRESLEAERTEVRRLGSVLAIMMKQRDEARKEGAGLSRQVKALKDRKMCGVACARTISDLERKIMGLLQKQASLLMLFHSTGEAHEKDLHKLDRELQGLRLFIKEIVSENPQ